MAKWYGNVGYVDTVETEPGIWEEKEVEVAYYGDFTRNTSRFQTSGGVNDDVTVSNEISIVADPTAIGHFSKIRYVELYGEKWKVTSVESKPPRLILGIGGLYNG